MTRGHNIFRLSFRTRSPSPPAARPIAALSHTETLMDNMRGIKHPPKINLDRSNSFFHHFPLFTNSSNKTAYTGLLQQRKIPNGTIIRGALGGLWTSFGGFKVLIAVITFGIMFILAAWFIYNICFHPLAAFPGPLLYRGSSLCKIYQQMRGNITFKMYELHQTYGLVVRVAPWELSYTSAQAWKDIYTGSISQKKSGAKEPLPPKIIYGAHEMEYFGAHSIMFQFSIADHSRHRRILSPSLSNKALRGQEPIIIKHADMFVQRMRERTSTAVDLTEWLKFLSFDIIGDLTFGESFGCLKKGEIHP